MQNVDGKSRFQDIHNQINKIVTKKVVSRVDCVFRVDLYLAMTIISFANIYTNTPLSLYESRTLLHSG